MSSWTRIFGVIKVDTCANTTAGAHYLADTVLHHMPIIAGSEMNMQYTHCEALSYTYDDWNINGTKIIGQHNSYQLIQIWGDLRDTNYDEIYREVVHYVCRLSKTLLVEDVLIHIDDRFFNSKIISYSRAYFDLYDYTRINKYIHLINS